MARRLTTGRFDTRAELCAAIWAEWLHSPRNTTDIARFCRVSPTTVAKILNTKEGLPSVPDPKESPCSDAINPTPSAA